VTYENRWRIERPYTCVKRRGACWRRDALLATRALHLNLKPQQSLRVESRVMSTRRCKAKVYACLRKLLGN